MLSFFSVWQKYKVSKNSNFFSVFVDFVHWLWSWYLIFVRVKLSTSTLFPCKYDHNPEYINTLQVEGAKIAELLGESKIWKKTTLFIRYSKVYLDNFCEYLRVPSKQNTLNFFGFITEGSGHLIVLSPNSGFQRGGYMASCPSPPNIALL